MPSGPDSPYTDFFLLSSRLKGLVGLSHPHSHLRKLSSRLGTPQLPLLTVFLDSPAASWRSLCFLVDSPRALREESLWLWVVQAHLLVSLLLLRHLLHIKCSSWPPRSERRWGEEARRGLGGSSLRICWTHWRMALPAPFLLTSPEQSLLRLLQLSDPPFAQQVPLLLCFVSFFFLRFIYLERENMRTRARICVCAREWERGRERIPCCQHEAHRRAQSHNPEPKLKSIVRRLTEPSRHPSSSLPS